MGTRPKTRQALHVALLDVFLTFSLESKRKPKRNISQAGGVRVLHSAFLCLSSYCWTIHWFCSLDWTGIKDLKPVHALSTHTQSIVLYWLVIMLWSAKKSTARQYKGKLKTYLVVSDRNIFHYASELWSAITSSEAYGRATSGHRKLHSDWLPLPQLHLKGLFIVSLQADQWNRQFLDTLSPTFHLFLLLCGSVQLGRCST